CDETKGFELGAVDYIIKPISPSILQARVKTHLKLRYTMQELKRLCNMALDANPLTGLPGNNSIKEVIEEAIYEKNKIGVIYTDLDNFKAFNDKYGFAMGDKVIKFTAQVIKDSLLSLEISDSNIFIGHIGGDDFVVISPSDKIHDVCKEIIKKFDEGIINFYNPEDAVAKCICSTNRRLEQECFPIMSISMAGVDLANSFYKEYLELNDVLAGLKKNAKAVEGSTFLIDRRVKTERL
ncbi:MAG: diguanylate cyclase, partial [Desulfamplus sp.]|nr:diguanylate cyclase [Desulfamplus sp.]